MIARNYIRYPEALRFQCEMFSNGYKNSPRIMRLMTVIFDWKVEAPQWVKDATRKARELVKLWKKAQIVLNFGAITQRTRPMVKGFFYGPMGESWTGRGLMPKWLRELVRNGACKEQFLFAG